MILNAGQRLWQVQQQQGTGLCAGLDPHYDPANGMFDEKMYARYEHPPLTDFYQRLVSCLADNPFPRGPFTDERRTAAFLSGVTHYLICVVETAWDSGLRVFKPQSAFYEQFGPFALVALGLVRNFIAELAKRYGCLTFVIDDAKRGDIDTTQAAYYRAILSDTDQETIPGMCGQLDFDAMTVTTWMGQDVFTPALPFIRSGKGVIVVTRSSNPSGTTFQDALTATNPNVPLADPQRPFQLTEETCRAVQETVGRPPMAHEVMLYLTEQFCRDHNLVQDGISPVFSVVGATTKMDNAFRLLRPTGIALIPAFGAQGGEFSNIIALAARQGPLAGHLGILNSARAIAFAWHQKFGGAGDPAPEKLAGEVRRAVNQFREEEKKAYLQAGLAYLF